MNRKVNVRKKGKTARNIILFCLGVAVAILVTGFLYINGILGKVRRVDTKPTDMVAQEDETFLMDGEEAQKNTMTAEGVLFDIDSIEAVPLTGEIRNILLIGQDARAYDGERQRSDSMIICSINTKDDRVILTSLMRDMYVPIPGYSDNRINAAYMFGGMQLLDDTIEQDFGLHIDGNIEVDFEGFIKAVTVLGGIDMELTWEEANYLNTRGWSDQGSDSSGWYLTEGNNHLTAEQALAYSRMRYVGNSDYERTDRQRKVIKAALKKARESGLGGMLSMANEVAPYLTTDMGNAELLSYITTLAGMDIADEDSHRLPIEGSYYDEVINEMAVLVPDLYMNNQYLHECIYGKTSGEDS